MSQSPYPSEIANASEPYRLLIETFPELRQIEDPAWLDAIGGAKVVEIPAETGGVEPGETVWARVLDWS